MRYAGGALCLPLANTLHGGSPIAYFHSDGEHLGNMWFDRQNMKVRVAMGQGDGNFIGLRTETYSREDSMLSYGGVRGYDDLLLIMIHIEIPVLQLFLQFQ